MKKISIACVEDHNLVRKSMATMINNFQQCEVILQASNGKDLQGRLDRGNLPDILLLDVRMPVMDGYETARWVRKEHPGIRVLILTMFDSELARMRLVQLGARGFLLKDIEPEILLDAILITMQTGYYYEEKTLASLLQSDDSNIPLVNNIILTPVELRFLEFACSEMTYKEIAMEMGPMSPKTLDHYREALFAKLNVKTRVGLALYAIENGIRPRT